MIDEVDAAVIATDADGNVRVWSRGAEALYGWTEEQALGQSVAELTVPAHFRDRMQGFVARLREETRWVGDLKLQRRDGTRFIGFVRASVVCDEDGVAVGFVGTSEDSAERMAAEAVLRTGREYLATVTDSMGEGLLALDDSGGILYMNASAEKLLGWNRHELLGRDFHETVHRHEGSLVADCQLMAARLGHQAVQVDSDVLYRRDGSPLPISCTSSPFELADGDA